LFNIDPIIKDILILVLTAGCAVSLTLLFKSRAFSARAQSAKITPILMPVIDPSDNTLHLQNDSAYFAKDISIDDCRVDLGYEFRRTISLTFAPITTLKPNQRVPLKIRAIDGASTPNPNEITNAGQHLCCDNYTMVLRFANIENSKLVETVAKGENGFALKDISEEKPRG